MAASTAPKLTPVQAGPAPEPPFDNMSLPYTLKFPPPPDDW